MDAARFALIVGMCDYARVVAHDGVVAAFLLALREGQAGYDSPNYRWFDARYDQFLYIDRVVVARAHQGRGLGTRLYEDLFACARGRAVERVTCEFDIDPPNPASAAFHARFGFHEVGRQALPSGKRVSLQAARA